MIIDKEMKRTIGYLWCAVLLMAVCAAGITSCKKELPSVDVASDAGVTVNYDIANVIVKNGSDVVPAAERVAVGTELTIEVVPAEEGYLPRSLKSLKVNGGEELGGPGVTSVTYKVKASDKVVSIMTECVGGIIELEYNEEEVIVRELLDGGKIGKDNISTGTHLKIGQKLVLISYDGGETPFTDLKINGESMIGKLKFVWGGAGAIYVVPKLIDKVKIEASYDAPIPPSGIALTFGADVKVEGKASGDKVAAGDKLTITPADATKVFEVLKINGNEIAAAAGKESYEYTVQASDTEVKIEAKVKAKAAPVALTFDKTVVKVDGKASGDKVSEGDKLTITPADATKVFETLKINGNEIAEAAGKESYEYTVKADDTEVKIEATLKAKATTITLTFGADVKVDGKASGDAVNVGDKLKIAPVDATKVFEKLTINGNEITAAAGKESYEYTVQSGDTKVEIVATVKAKATPITLTFGAEVKVAGKTTGAEVAVGDKLTITPADATKVFEKLTINGNEIAAAAGKESYEYEVKAGDTEVKIEATLKAKVTPIKLTFGAEVQVAGKTTGAEVTVGEKLVIKPADATKVFETLRINGNEIAAAAGKESYEYTVQTGDTKVEIVATVKAKATPITLTFTATDVKVEGKASGDKVTVGDKLVITPAVVGKKFAELKINDAAIAEAVDKDTFTYTVKADDTKVEIVATLK